MKNKCKNVENHSGHDVWRTVIPMIYDKCKVTNNVILLEGNLVENEPFVVADILNDYFVNIAKDIGSPDNISEADQFDTITSKHKTSDSIKFKMYT